MRETQLVILSLLLFIAYRIVDNRDREKLAWYAKFLDAQVNGETVDTCTE